jgi:hypothetical protein
MRRQHARASLFPRLVDAIRRQAKEPRPAQKRVGSVTRICSLCKHYFFNNSTAPIARAISSIGLLVRLDALNAPTLGFASI